MGSTFRAIGQSPTRNALVSEIRRDCRGADHSFGVPGCFLNTQTDFAEMDRAILSYNPQLDRAILRRLSALPC